jgi:hypothetical protein
MNVETSTTTSTTDGKTPRIQENIIAENVRVKEVPAQTNVFENSGQPTLSADTTDRPKKQKKIDPKGIPDRVANRYLKVEDKYYLPDKTVAFEDRGNKLKLDTENREVIKDALDIAETRGWESITVTGTNNFKHQVWREATIKGIAVNGYKPTALEIAELNHDIELRKTRKEPVKAKENQDSAIRGILLAHGANHYQHNPKQGQSYFVTLDVGGKEVTRWGADLKRAFTESQSLPQIGDIVTLSNTGKQAVEITTTAVDSQGNPVEDKKMVKKNTWRIEKAEYYDTIRENAEALRVGNEIERRVIEQNPQLANAIAVSKLGEKIAEQAKVTGAIRSQEEVDTMVRHINNGLAEALVKGKKINAPEIQEQGKRAALIANNVTNDHLPPEMIKDPKHQVADITR